MNRGKTGDEDDGRNVIKDVEITAESGSAVSVGGDAVVGTLIKDVAGNVIVHQHVSDKAAARNRRIRRHLLEQLQATWIEGVLENSLYEAARLELGLESQPDAVERPWVMDLERPNQPAETLPPTSKILDIFKGLNGAMLILGDPGSGKTITLLELARELRKAALEDERQPAPLVFNLSSWGRERPPLVDWLVEELFLVYGVGRKQGPEWLKAMPFHLLLDGLDEVAGEYREDCVGAVNAFREVYGPVNVVVCSRTAEYEGLANRLQLTGGVVIRPLSREQIETYLAAAGEGLAQIVNHDEALLELAETPLMLNIIALAYRERPPDEITAGTKKERRHHLFTAYVNRMFERRGAVEEVDKQQAVGYLAWLAGRMEEHDQSVFYIEKMQPAWLGRHQRLFKTIRALIFGLSFVLIIGLSGSLFSTLSMGMSVGLVGGLITGIAFGLLQGLFGGREGIKSAETLTWSWKNGLVFLLIFLVSFGIFGGLSGGLFGGVIGGLFGGLSGKELERRSAPNQGIRLSGRNGLIVGLIGGLITGLGIGLSAGPGVGLRYGVGFGLGFGLLFGGAAFVQHVVLRGLLAGYNYLPLKLVPFLDGMAERIILRKVGGGYIFVHRMLLGYFAGLEGESEQPPVETGV